MKENLLPHYWKMIALALFVLAIGIWFVNAANPELINLDPYKFSWILKIIILISLLLFVSTKEKVENERTATLRSSCIKTAFNFGAFFLVYEFFAEIIFQGENAEVISGYELMMLMLVFYYLNFYFKKNIRTVKRD
ncbi:hypothetical protein [Salinimicrobium sediminilitoris]|uniref:hypothetical protein n=1 Tax=Salinimicrobium sediminilitoris TaxID=2876715 RepID=UPI001E645BA8|nr:hypothetical protein [Salinimicrobium sediminilitoris]MCC8360173.1 hypothetical protein [Salinimicrobium sediminilitoris]